MENHLLHFALFSLAASSERQLTLGCCQPTLCTKKKKHPTHVNLHASFWMEPSPHCTAGMGSGEGGNEERMGKYEVDKTTTERQGQF